MDLPIYLDYSSTTPVDKRVFNKMLNYLKFDGIFGNASSRSHIFGWLAEKEINIARKKISNLIGSRFKEIIFTSGATESNNLAIKGILNFYFKKGNHIITSKIEHKSVLDTCYQLEKRGYKITYIKINNNGLINIKNLKSKIFNRTILISIMHVNNEIGVIQNIKTIGKICKKNNIIFHVDAAQSLGKLNINLSRLNVNLMSFSSHKIYGPKGIGVLFISSKPHIYIEAQIHGGGHENGIRSGTLPIHQIVGFSEACFLLQKKMLNEQLRITKLKKIFLNGIKKIEKINLNSYFKNTIPNIINISFLYIEGESLIMALKDLAISSGSACTSLNLESSYVLNSLGISNELSHSSLRFSIGRYTSKNNINYIINLLKKSISSLRSLSPLWEMYKEGINIKKVKWN